MEKKLTLDEIIEFVQSITGVDVRERSRKSHVVNARAVYFCLAFEYSGEIGQKIGAKIGFSGPNAFNHRKRTLDFNENDIRKELLNKCKQLIKIHYE